MNSTGENTKPAGSMSQQSALARYGSAPGSFLAALADSVARGEIQAVGSDGGGGGAGMTSSRFFSAESSGLTSCESSSGRTGQLERAYAGSGEFHVAAVGAGDGAGPHVSGAPLFRHSSMPAGSLSRLMVDHHHGHHGVGGSGGTGSYSQTSSDAANAMINRRLSSQWSFSRQDLPQISEMGMIPDMGESITGCGSSTEGAYLSRSFSINSWDDTNSIMFSHANKKPKDNNDDILTTLSNLDSQFGLAKGSIEISNMEDYLQTHQDSIKVPAKRGFATHPRSIAERERRTRISKRLKKLEVFVPNMDKQTNTADMLDLAVGYIKELQGQVEKLKQEQANCICSNKKK